MRIKSHLYICRKAAATTVSSAMEREDLGMRAKDIVLYRDEKLEYTSVISMNSFITSKFLM